MALSWKRVSSQLFGGSTPTTTPAASTDVGGMVAYIAAGSVVGYQATSQTVPFRTRLPDNDQLYPGQTAPNGTTVWPAANQAIYIPFELSQTRTLTNVHVGIATSSGNLDVGIYSSAGVKQATKGATAMSAAGHQTIALSVALTAGRYYAAISVDNGTAALFGWGMVNFAFSGNLPDAIGIKKENTAYVLPASATPATPSSNYVPMIVLEWS